jgi:hypothetical protein
MYGVVYRVMYNLAETRTSRQDVLTVGLGCACDMVVKDRVYQKSQLAPRLHHTLGRAPALRL